MLDSDTPRESLAGVTRVGTRTAFHARVLLRRFFRNEHLILSVLALVIGGVSALGAVAFRLGIGSVQFLGFGFTSELVLTGTRVLPWWQILLVPTIGGLAVGVFLDRFIRGGRAHGVAQVIEAGGSPGCRMSFRDGIVSAVGSMASLGVGASTGREGPVVHLGATLGAWLAERLQLNQRGSRTLLGCGVAAAVAASFNAPIAGVLFALEVVIGHHALRAFAPIVVAAVTGTAIGRAAFGDAPAFVVPENYILSFWEFPAFVLLGVVSAIVAITFIHGTFLSASLAEKLPVPSWTRPALAGLVVGTIAIFLPHVLGVGYEATDIALRGEFELTLLISLIVVKLAATAICLGFGFGGGVFSPSLFLGAMVGGAFGIAAGSVFPDLYSGTSAYALIGTGAVAGAVLGAPMSTILIIFELTGDYAMTIAVMIATVVASLITQQFYARSFFYRQLERSGVDVHKVHEQALLRSMRVDEVMRTDYVTVGPDANVNEVRARLQDAPYGELFVVDGDDRLHGVLTYAELDAAVSKADNDSLTASDMARPSPTVLLAGDDLDRALGVMRMEREEHVPVVADLEGLTVVGFVHERDVMHAYNRTLLEERAEERGHK